MFLCIQRSKETSRAGDGLNAPGGQKGFTVLEALIALFVVGLLFGILVARGKAVVRAARESAVKAELVNIRTSIQLFRMLNGRNPKSLNELVEKDVMLPARIGPGPYSGSLIKRKYLLANAVDRNGNVLDPFGGHFSYDPARGEVKSGTKGCELW